MTARGRYRLLLVMAQGAAWALAAGATVFVLRLVGLAG